MKLGLQTWGSDGDIRPFIALAGGLSAAGHDVTLAVTSVDNKDYTSLSKTLNFTIKHIGHFDYNPEEIDCFGEKMMITRNPLQQIKLIASCFFEPAIEPIYEESLRLCNENDMVIGHFFVYPLGITAEKAGRPYISVSLSSATIPSRHIPPPGFPNLGKGMNFFLWKLAEIFMGMILLPAVNRRRMQEQLRPAKKIFAEVMASNTLNLIAASSFLCPLQPDWKKHHQVCGFFNIPEHGEQWRMPDRLRRLTGISSRIVPPLCTMAAPALLSRQWYTDALRWWWSTLRIRCSGEEN